MPTVPIALCLCLVVASAVDAQRPMLPSDTLRVSAKYFSDTSTIGAVITAKFRTSPQRAAVFRLDAPIDSTGGRVWLLEDVLVSLDIDGGGFIAIWRVAGPRRVIEAHLARVLELAKDRSVIYDYDIRRAIVRCACD